MLLSAAPLCAVLCSLREQLREPLGQCLRLSEWCASVSGLACGIPIGAHGSSCHSREERDLLDDTEMHLGGENEKRVEKLEERG